jgi:hypothetical protein
MTTHSSFGRKDQHHPWAVLKHFDAFPKARDEAADFFHKTASGGIITIVAAVVMSLLFISEMGIYVKVRTASELSVDTSRGETLEIHVDVTLPRMPCSWVSVDVMDVSGEVHIDVEHDLFKQRLDGAGQPLAEFDPVKHHVGPSATVSNVGGQDGADENGRCGSCYGAENPTAGVKCCNTCGEVSWSGCEAKEHNNCHVIALLCRNEQCIMFFYTWDLRGGGLDSATFRETPKNKYLAHRERLGVLFLTPATESSIPLQAFQRPFTPGNTYAPKVHLVLIVEINKRTASPKRG